MIAMGWPNIPSRLELPPPKTTCCKSTRQSMTATAVGPTKLLFMSNFLLSDAPSAFVQSQNIARTAANCEALSIVADSKTSRLVAKGMDASRRRRKSPGRFYTAHSKPPAKLAAIQRLLFLHRRERLFHQPAPQLLFVLFRYLNIANDMDDTIAEHQPVGANHFRHRQRRGDLHRRDASLFQFRCDRSAAASAGPSSRS